MLLLGLLVVAIATLWAVLSWLVSMPLNDGTPRVIDGPSAYSRPRATRSGPPPTPRVAILVPPSSAPAAPALSPPPAAAPSEAPSGTDASPAPGATYWLLIDRAYFPDADDLDRDGLSVRRERALGTEEWSWDTDLGGESDGAEVAAGRNPLKKGDDVPPATCIPKGARNWDGSAPAVSPPPAPELEAVIPRHISGHFVVKSSVKGLPRRYGFFNSFWDALLICAQKQPPDLAHAIGSSRYLDGFTVFAIRIRGMSGAEVERMFIGYVVDYGRGEVHPYPVRIGPRTYILLTRLGATYSSGDVFFWMVTAKWYDFGFAIENEKIHFDHIADTVRQLGERDPSPPRAIR